MNLEVDDYPLMHILGCLYGQALGNAWAMPAYLDPSRTWNHYGGWIDKLLPAPNDHPFYPGFQAGQVTTDTQHTMALAQSIIKNGLVTVDGVAEALINWYDQLDNKHPLYIEPCLSKAIASLKLGVSPYQTGLYSETNGGATMVSPVGLIHPGNLDSAIEDAIIACTPIHFTNVAVSAACAVSAAVAQAVSPDATLEYIIDAGIYGAEVGYHRGVPWFGASVARKIDAAVRLATDTNFTEYERLLDLYDLIGSTLSAADAVPCAFGILAMSGGDTVQSAIYASALSGDADTVGSIACAIAGAWHSIETIPVEYIEIINQANPQYDFEDVAEGLYNIVHEKYLASAEDTEDMLNTISNL